MNPEAMFYLLLALFLGIAVLCVKPLGSYIADVMEGRAGLALRAGGRSVRDPGDPQFLADAGKDSNPIRSNRAT